MHKLQGLHMAKDAVFKCIAQWIHLENNKNEHQQKQFLGLGQEKVKGVHPHRTSIRRKVKEAFKEKEKTF